MSCGPTVCQSPGWALGHGGAQHCGCQGLSVQTPGPHSCGHLLACNRGLVTAPLIFRICPSKIGASCSLATTVPCARVGPRGGGDLVLQSTRGHLPGRGDLHCHRAQVDALQVVMTRAVMDYRGHAPGGCAACCHRAQAGAEAGWGRRDKGRLGRVGRDFPGKPPERVGVSGVCLAEAVEEGALLSRKRGRGSSQGCTGTLGDAGFCRKWSRLGRWLCLLGHRPGLGIGACSS